MATKMDVFFLFSTKFVKKSHYFIYFFADRELL